jgi:hypothetical protein
MTTPIILPKLPRPNSAGHHYIGDHELRARDLEVARVVLEGAAKACDAVAIDATSEKRMKFLSVQGQAIYEGMYGGAINCAAGVRNLEIKHHE